MASDAAGQTARPGRKKEKKKKQVRADLILIAPVVLVERERALGRERAALGAGGGEAARLGNKLDLLRCDRRRARLGRQARHGAAVVVERDRRRRHAGGAAGVPPAVAGGARLLRKKSHRTSSFTHRLPSAMVMLHPLGQAWGNSPRRDASLSSPPTAAPNDCGAFVFMVSACGGEEKRHTVVHRRPSVNEHDITHGGERGGGGGRGRGSGSGSGSGGESRGGGGSGGGSRAQRREQGTGAKTGAQLRVSPRGSRTAERILNKASSSASR